MVRKLPLSVALCLAAAAAGAFYLTRSEKALAVSKAEPGPSGTKVVAYYFHINACAELDLTADISHVTNIADIIELGVTRTPGVVVDGKVVVCGHVPTVAELRQLLNSKEACDELL